MGAVTDEQLIAMPFDRARGGGLQLTGEGGLLQQLTKPVLESALDGEITDHVGYDKHDLAGRGSGITRNGSRTKTCSPTSDRSRFGCRATRRVCEPQIVRKR
ncbi:transposase [Micromonospora arborensis]